MITLPESLVDAFITEVMRRGDERGDASFADEAVGALAAAMSQYAAGLVIRPLTGIVFGSIVYYLRRANGDIKIGYSAYSSTRLTQIMREHGHIDVLAYEPGGAVLETKRHGQFDHHRITDRGEWFRPGVDLLHHIQTLNAAIEAAHRAILCVQCPASSSAK